MGWILLLGAGVVVGLVIARWWLLPVPVRRLLHPGRGFPGGS
jgi:hypothetical protein